MSKVSNHHSYFLNDNIAKSIVEFDKMLKILNLSRYAFEEYKIDPKQVIGMNLKDIISEKSWPKLDEFINRLEMGVNKFEEVELLLNIKKKRQIKLVASTKFDKEKNYVSYLAVIENITETKALHRKNFDLIQQFKQLQSNAQIGLWKYDINQKYLLWSDELYLMHQAFIGSEITISQAIEMFYPYDRDKFQDAVELCLFEGHRFEKDLRVVTSDNQLIWVRVKGEPLYKLNEIQGVFGTYQNITEKKNLEFSLSKESHSALQHKNILDSFSIVAKTDLHGKITYVNDKFCEISKYDRNELIGKDHRIVNSGHHPKEFFEQMWNTINSGKTWSAEIKNRAKDGSFYWVNTYITPMFDSSGAFQCYMAIRFDITKEKELEEVVEIERQRATINAQLASVGEMSTGIVHEINNPLTVIAGMNALIPKQIKNEQGLLKIHKSISNSVERMHNIIKGLKRLSHKSDKERLEIVPLIDLLEDSLSFIKESLNYHHINFQLGDMPYDVVLECREVEISQVLLNLVNNARDSIVEADVEDKWIKVDFEDFEKFIRIKVVDSGPGIPPEIQDKIMEQFFTTKKVGKGTGLGLSLSSRIIQDHGGQLFLDKNSKNTTFVIELPKKLEVMAS